MPLTLITGAPGWIGTRLVRALVDGIPDAPGLAADGPQRNLRCLVRPGEDTTRLNGSGTIQITPGDLRNPDELEVFLRGAEWATLFHCAGLIHPRLFVRELFDINVHGTRNLLQAAEKAGVRRVVVLSSNAPAGNNPRRDHRFDESSPYHPYMSYGRSKMLMEQVMHEHQARGLLETVVVRPTWFYGPDQPLRQTTFFTMIRKGLAPIVGDGENMRSMTYIDNLCQALLLCERSAHANGQTYWVADRRPYSMNEIVNTVECLMESEFGVQVAHKRLRLPYVAGQLAQVGDAIFQGLGLYQQKIHVMSEMNKTIACSIEKARRELGYEPAVELEEGMRRSLAWCVENGIAF